MDSQEYIPVNSPGSNSQQLLNWTCADNDKLTVNLTLQGAVAMFIERDTSDKQLPPTDLLAIGSPADNGPRGAVNIYTYSTITHSFDWTQSILPPNPFVPPAANNPIPVRLSIGSGLGMGNKVLAVGSDDHYVFVYRYAYSIQLKRWKYFKDTVLCACNCENFVANGKATSPCTTIAMPQDASRLIVTEVGSAANGVAAGKANAGVLKIYRSSAFPFKSDSSAASNTWSNAQTLSVSDVCSAGLQALGTPNNGVGYR